MFPFAFDDDPCFYLQGFSLIQKMEIKYFLVSLSQSLEYNVVKQGPFRVYFLNLGHKKISVVFVLILL